MLYYAYNITHFQPLLIGLGHVEVHSVRGYTYNVVMLIIGVVSFPGLKYDTNGDTSYYDIMHYKGCLLNKRLQFERGVHSWDSEFGTHMELIIGVASFLGFSGEHLKG